MSRSRRKTPVIGITTAESDKAFKQAEHRRERRAVKAIIRGSDEPPPAKTFGDPWDGQKDGKQWIGDQRPDLLRK